MDRRYRSLVTVVALSSCLASLGCQGAFHRRGIPPEPKAFQDSGPAQFNADPSPTPPNMGLAPMNPASGTGSGPYGNVAPYGGETVPPLGQVSGGIPGTGGAPISEPPGDAGSPSPY